MFKLSTLFKMLLGMHFRLSVGEGTGGGKDNAEAEAAAARLAEAEAAEAEAAEAAAAEAAAAAKNKPTDAEAKLLKEVMDKKNALKRTQEDLAAVNAKLKEFEGLDPAEIRQLVQERKDLQTKQLEEKGDWERLKAQMAEENQKAINLVNEQLSASEARAKALSSTVAELTVGGAFTASAFLSELTLTKTKARLIYGPHFEFVDNAVVGYDKPAGASERTMLVDGQGKPLAFDVAIKKLVDADPDKDELYKSKVKPGSGSKTDSRTKAPAEKFDTALSGKDRIAAALANGAMK